MDAMARSRQSTPSSTPALSFASTVSSSEEDFPVDEDESDGLSTPKFPPTSEQVFNTSHSEFGHCANEQYRHLSKYRPGSSFTLEEHDPPYYVLIMTYLSYIVLIVIGHIRDFLGKRFKPFAYKHLKKNDVCLRSLLGSL
jgi:serine palmitoyltransferase